MHVLIAFDKFKDCMTATEACDTARRALGRAKPDWTATVCPLTDGGEGFRQVLTAAAGGMTLRARVPGPRDNVGLVTAGIGLVDAHQIPDSARELLGWAPGSDAARPERLAIVEMAEASGLALLPLAGRDVWRATTVGTGELLRRACDEADGVLLGIGGSATHDLGLGALSGMGIRFLDTNGRVIDDLSPGQWARIAHVEREGDPTAPIRIACDVTHPLLGRGGAAHTFAPQKGLPNADGDRLEAESERMARLLCEAFGRDFTAMTSAAGSGAAGGISFGLEVVFGAKRTVGASLVEAWLDLESKIRAADLVFTGEGMFDATSAGGKGPGALLESCRRLGRPAWVFAGRVEKERSPGDARLFEIGDRRVSLPENLKGGVRNLEHNVEKALRVAEL